MPLTPCPDCAHDVSDAASCCPHCGRPLGPAAAKQLEGGEDVRTIGALAAAAGLVWMVLAIFMGTGVQSGIGEVHNLSRAHAQLLHFLAGAVLLLAGLLLIAIGHLRRVEVSRPSIAPDGLKLTTPVGVSPSDRVMCPLCYRFNDVGTQRCRCGKLLQDHQPT
jgi:hypothetical protein